MKTPNQIRGHIGDNEMAILTKEASKVPKDGVIVEIGSYCGKSTVTLAIANPMANVFAIDPWGDRVINGKPDPDKWDEFKNNIVGLSNITPIKDYSENVGAMWKLDINLLFIDGDHTKFGVYTDLQLWIPHVVKGGVVLLHDYTEKCGVRPAWESYLEIHEIEKRETQVINSILRVQL